MIDNREQPKQIAVNDLLVLVKYYPYYSRALAWYQDPTVCWQVDHIDHIYDLDRLKRMYRYLSRKGECYYIKYKDGGVWRLVGDASICDGEISIVISRAYQNRHIGRLVIAALLQRGMQLGLDRISETIYRFNKQSRRAFLAAGFRQTESEKYVIDL